MAKRNKCAVMRNRRRVNRYHKRSDESTDSEEMSTEIKEIFDQMDIIYGELEGKLNSNDSFAYQSRDLCDLDNSIDFVFEQIGKWLVGYCGCLVQQEQTGQIEIECLENLLDKLLGINYQLDCWDELVRSVVHDLRDAFKQEKSAIVPLKDLDELERRQQRVKDVQNYLIRIKERHQNHLLTNDQRPFSQLSAQEKDSLALRYSRFIQASFPSTSVERLQEIIGKVTIDKIPHLLQAY
ncbi:hypothetical protein M3Y97_00624900 [Aphelenchoides bicaudatus]|nr:hypothetical protein M3Y97_00624900 [Aphelenchoides bicaudatus]